MKKKKTNMRTVIRQIVREEVAMAIQEVLTELKQPTQPTQSTQSTKPVEKKSYTKNSVLNDVLNETAQGDDWKTLGGAKYTTERMNELVGGQYANMMNDDSDTPQQNVNLNDPMSQFVNKDYRKVLEKTEEIHNRKHGK
jgi:hypothetical protein